MKQRNIPYGRIGFHVAVVIAMAALSGWLCAGGHYAYLLVTVPVAGLSIYRLFMLYGEIVQRLMFVFNAVQNDDYSFRFAEDPRVTRYALVNYSLNRIKEVLDTTKLRIREREK